MQYDRYHVLDGEEVEAERIARFLNRSNSSSRCSAAAKVQSQGVASFVSAQSDRMSCLIKPQMDISHIVKFRDSLCKSGTNVEGRIGEKKDMRCR